MLLNLKIFRYVTLLGIAELVDQAPAWSTGSSYKYIIWIRKVSGDCFSLIWNPTSMYVVAQTWSTQLHPLEIQFVSEMEYSKSREKNTGENDCSPQFVFKSTTRLFLKISHSLSKAILTENQLILAISNWNFDKSRPTLYFVSSICVLHYWKYNWIHLHIKNKQWPIFKISK